MYFKSSQSGLGRELNIVSATQAPAFNPQNPHKKLGVVAHTCSPQGWKDGDRQVDPRACSQSG